MFEGRTVVAIAHRLQTVHDADRWPWSRTAEHDGSSAAQWESWHGGR